MHDGSTRHYPPRRARRLRQDGAAPPGGRSPRRRARRWSVSPTRWPTPRSLKGLIPADARIVADVAAAAGDAARRRAHRDAAAHALLDCADRLSKPACTSTSRSRSRCRRPRPRRSWLSPPSTAFRSVPGTRTCSSARRSSRASRSAPSAASSTSRASFRSGRCGGRSRRSIRRRTSSRMPCIRWSIRCGPAPASTTPPLPSSAWTSGRRGDVYALLRLGDCTGVLLVTLSGRPIEQYQTIVGTNGVDARRLRDRIGDAPARARAPGPGSCSRPFAAPGRPSRRRRRTWPASSSAITARIPA